MHAQHRIGDPDRDEEEDVGTEASEGPLTQKSLGVPTQPLSSGDSYQLYASAHRARYPNHLHLTCPPASNLKSLNRAVA
jgi:hypothetical protein